MMPTSFHRLAKATLFFAGICAAANVSGTKVHAQAWLPDRAYTEGPGIRAGNLEIHPGVAVRGGYNNNVFLADGDKRSTVVDGRNVNLTQRRQGAAALAVTPHINISTLGVQRRQQGEDRDTSNSLPMLAFRGGASATYFQYFLANAPRNLEVDTDLALTIAPQRPVSLDLSIAYARNVRPFTQNAFNRNAYNNDVVLPRARFNFGSRSRVLTAYVGYDPRFTLFESNIFDYLNNFKHDIEVGAGWRFLPSTALVYDANLEFQQYRKDDPATTRSPVLYSDNRRFRTRAGLNGAITQRLTARALAGYAAIAFDDGHGGRLLDDHEDVVAEVALNYKFGPAQSSTYEVGFNRDLQSSYLGGWVRLDRGYMVLRSLVGRMLLLSLEGGLAKAAFGSLYGFDRRGGTADIVPLGANNTTHRKDIRVDGAVRGELRVTNWLSFTADVAVQAAITDFQYSVLVNGGTPVPDPARYWALTAFGGVRAHY